MNLAYLACWVSELRLEVVLWIGKCPGIRTSKMCVVEEEVRLKQFVSLLKFKIRLAAGLLSAD